MLILSRKKQQKVRLQFPDGSVGWVVLVDVDRNKVRIGFDFGEDVLITREELLHFTEYRQGHNTTSKEQSHAKSEGQEGDIEDIVGKDPNQEDEYNDL